MSDETLPGELDNEFVTVAGDYDKQMSTAIAKAAESQVAAKVKRTRTYMTSEIPVRPCTEDCPIRDRCKDFLNGRVEDGDLCKPELRQIKKWQVAFRKGELDKLKDDVGAVAGSMAVQVNRLLDAVNKDGVIVETVKYTNTGQKYFEKMAHPALQQAANLLKTLGIDLQEFLMTPKSARGAPPPVQVNIGISAEEVHARFAARFGTGDTERADDS
ncbi:hypothetical protein LLE49_19445 [Alicyclobacillus tolerans]|uniref:hypothetical protein n=1 Tax=Alicyclobacillus tolerans TaxID=90970 RepID=UPI001F2F5940|nr:hypothetical protein [Alicyclobacillus tolerans]MCF8566897.1 hypothetical protein [Alicyclobacillus tolerans]